MKIMTNAGIATTLESIRSTIQTDPFAARWFLFLVRQNDIRVKWRSDSSIDSLYQRLDRLTFQKLIMLTAVSAAVISFLEEGPSLLLIIIPAGIFFYLRSRALVRSTVGEIAIQILTADFKSEELHKKTLYQISEHYSRRHRIISLVDAIAASDKVMQITILAAVSLPLLLQNFDLLKITMIVLTAWAAVKILIGADLVYSRLK